MKSTTYAPIIVLSRYHERHWRFRGKRHGFHPQEVYHLIKTTGRILKKKIEMQGSIGYAKHLVHRAVQ